MQPLALQCRAGRLGGEGLAAGGQDLLLMDVTPLTLSIETVGNGSPSDRPQLHHSHPVFQIFTTRRAVQAQLKSKVLQGEQGSS